MAQPITGVCHPGVEAIGDFPPAGKVPGAGGRPPAEEYELTA